MRISRSVRTVVVWAAALGTCFSTPGLVYGATASLPAPEGSSPVVTDVALHDGGVLAGQVSDSNGTVQTAVRVSLQNTQSQEIATGVTDQQGAFRVRGVRPGVYQIVTPQARGFYRLWAPGTAPASARPTAMVVGDTVRGGVGDWASAHPVATVLVIGGVAAAIAVPLALTNNHKSN